MDLSSRFSAGVRRVVEAALRLVPTPEDLHSRHLLWALWIDESRAADLLVRAGTTDDILIAALGPLEAPTTTDSTLDADRPFPRSALFLSIVDDAHRQAIEEATGSEILTEHLLRGVISTDPDLSARLAALGVRMDELRQPFSPQAELAATPLHTDVRLRAYAPEITERVFQLRLLDAAFNRCREGLRVLEDHVRFTRDDPHLTRLVKEIRHQLVPLSRRLNVDEALAVRDTQNDVGTVIQTTSEMSRESLADVLRANARRVEESLRSIEEYGKLIDPAVAGEISQLRYRVYTLERALLAGEERTARIAKCRLYLLVSDHLCMRGMGDVVREAIAGGVDVVQLREKGLSERHLFDLASYVRDWTAEHDVLFIMNDRPDMAALVHADGLHLGQDDLPIHEARRIVGSKMLIGVSTHTLEQAWTAVVNGADYLGVGPCFPSATKAFTEFAGLDFVRYAAAEIRLPWFAIGGINSETLPTVIEAGGQRIAVSGTICGAESPQRAAAELRDLLDQNPLTSGEG